jgi:hypothetical protein
MRKIIVTIGLAALVLGACGQQEEVGGGEETGVEEPVVEESADEEPIVEESEEPAEAAGDDEWDPQVRTNFLEACLATSGGAEGYCGCTLDRLEERFSEAEFEAMEQEMMTSDVMPAEFEEIIEACVGEHEDELAGDPTDAAEGQWSQMARTEFLGACIESSGGATAYCECALEGLEAEYDEFEFGMISLGIEDGDEIPPEFESVIERCADEHA